MMVAGIVLTGVGALGLVSGGVLIAAAQNRTTISCDSLGCSQSTDQAEGQRTAGTGLIIAGIACLGAGIPLWIVGARKVPIGGGEKQPVNETVQARASLMLSPARTGLSISF